MFETTIHVDRKAEAVLEHARTQRRIAQQAEAEVLAAALAWAHLHPCAGLLDHPDADADGNTSTTVLGGLEREIPLAGEGTPTVGEFAIAEFAAALGMSTDAGRCLLGDALELFHRLPRVWARIHAGHLPTWRARRIAQATRWLSPDAVAHVDAQVAPFAHRISVGRVDKLVEAAAAQFQPDQAAQRAAAAADRRRVKIFDDTTLQGTCHIEIEADTLDAKAFDHTLGELADRLAAYGDTDTLDIRRAKALGVLADPQHALNLLNVTPDVPRGPTTELVLYLHLSDQAITGGMTLGRLEGSTSNGDQPLLTDQIRDWAGRPDTRITVRPVLDLNDRPAVDRHESPARMTEHVILRDRTCVFPHCQRPARCCDRDHIRPYDPDGPPGQTSTDNLACLCRFHHRLKTFGGWTYIQTEPGRFVWTSPRGHRYLRDETGTQALPNTPPPQR